MCKKLKIETLELSKFVSNTLMQIFKGINEAQKQAETAGFKINIYDLADIDYSQGKKPSKESIKSVDFELSVTTAGISEKGGNISVISAETGLNLGFRKRKENTSLNRVKFSIPVYFSDMEKN